ncbi:membrane fusion protein, multidrug efflux system [Cnuella takakiae]|uniref:Membrane fusion protein, multidrug efflux system n=1 Tax=Cnuella takakiae TaxID=1302690 RepID=A0A1M4Y4Q2_9BACT|nr:efflux RND transporter periplasmic adaptor subunit [Cnuella takakiae]OLY93047.1 efflux transporter periplasmic adaptor subunit [Cnuella takakiae]SHF00675.1 membrane fusion protein, multidrug efflux system [Cnuella takakiae]
MKLTLHAFALPLIGVYLSACSLNSQENKNDEKPKLPVTQVLAKDTLLHKAYVADIEAVKNVEIRNRVTGFLDKIMVDEGQYVKAGQTLFVLSSKEYQTEVAKAKAALSNAFAEAKTAEVELQRVGTLVEKKVVSPSELEMAKAKMEAQRAKIAEARSVLTDAQTRLSYTVVRAPFTGIINRIPLKTGSLVAEGSLLTTVSDINWVYTYFHISEDEYLNYLNAKKANRSHRNTVELTLANGKAYPHEGTIETIASEFDESTGSIAFRARFPNPENLLKHGATGKVNLETSVEKALLLPQKSVFEIQDKNYVYVVDKDNKVRMRSFVPRTRLSHFYIVQSGLKEGERIVFEGVQSLRDGMEIIPQPMAGAAVAQAL